MSFDDDDADTDDGDVDDDIDYDVMATFSFAYYRHNRKRPQILPTISYYLWLLCDGGQQLLKLYTFKQFSRL